MGIQTMQSGMDGKQKQSRMDAREGRPEIWWVQRGSALSTGEYPFLPSMRSASAG